MPEGGIDYVPRSELMSYEEMLRLAAIVADMGISKIRITGGEPFLRKDLWSFLEKLSKVSGIEKLRITTNGLLTRAYIPHFKSIGLNSVNLSLDSLDRERFKKITRRDALDEVLMSLNALMAAGIETKINCVVMAGMNEADIIPMVQLTEEKNISVRFIEEMPFNGSGSRTPELEWNHHKILEHIQTSYTDIIKLEDPPFSTSLNYKVEGHKGSFGIIPAFSRTFCGSCNRLRMTAQGDMKTCLYGSDVLNVKHLIRSGESDTAIADAIMNAISQRAKDGFKAAIENATSADLSRSMSTIGG